ncbi:MAG: DegV family EDD domain-containing protein [Lachnospiraceae bacterium]|nr:DegV family EDD domain-containing protein [Lachnospiraceae bacterium]
MEMDRVLISTDCISDLSVDIQNEYGISTMYCYVQTEEARFQDIYEITSDNLIEYMQQGKEAYSCVASEEEYRMYFEGLRKKHAGPIIHVSTARYVSKGFRVAAAVAEKMENVYVVDSGQLSCGLGIIVMKAADMAKKGAICELILQELEKMKKKASTSFVVDSTSALYRNSRISRRAFQICDMLNLHPILQMKNSKLCPAGFCFGNRRRFVRAYLNRMLEHQETIDKDIAFITTSGCSYEQQQFIREELEKKVQFKKLFFTTASATIASNCGAGTFGVLFMRK